MELNVADLYQKKTDEKLVNDANRMPTVPTGAYTLSVTNLSAQVGDNPKFPPLYEREHVHLRANLEKDGKRLGAIWFDMSWVDKRNEEGKLDGPAKLWGQAVRALNLGDASVGEVLDALKQYPMTAYVSERFHLEEEWKSARNEKERSDLLVAGAEPRNFIVSLSKIK